jgi:glyoxylase-like metal-dependent hydrolase (beta-lactamase superfamily II)/ketopantoate reductase
MKLLYIFDDKIKPLVMTDRGYCKPAETGIFGGGIKCIRVYDVNFWLYEKNGEIIAFDSGHRNFPEIDSEFQKIGVDPKKIHHVFLTHLDTDHAGGLDLSGRNIFPNAKIYMGADEKKYMTGEIFRTKKFGVNIKNCVQISADFFPVSGRTEFFIGGIKIVAIPTPGHTVGHTCYVVDEKILVTGDCLAINENGGYAFFDFFTQNPEQNKESLKKLRAEIQDKKIQFVCTGHSGIHEFSPRIFAHIDESAPFGRGKKFHADAPRNPFRDENRNRKMRILIYGAGVIGSNLAADFFKGKKDTVILARNDRAKNLMQDGLQIQGMIPRKKRTYKIKVAEELRGHDTFDAIFVTVRYTQIEKILPSLQKNSCRNIIFVGNNVNCTELAERLHGKNVLFAFSYSAGRRENGKVVSVNMKKIVIGGLKGKNPDKKFIRGIFSGTKIRVKIQPDMEDYLLCHAAFVVPVSFACYFAGGNLKKIQRDKKILNQVIFAATDGFRAIKKSGRKILPESDENFETKKWRRTVYAFLKIMCATPLGKICAADHAMNATEEMSALASDFENFMKKNGADFPEWKKLKECAKKYLQ